MSRFHVPPLLAVLVATVASCEFATEEDFSKESHDVTSDNGVWSNGVWSNGVWSNGVWSNGVDDESLCADPANPWGTGEYCQGVLREEYIAAGGSWRLPGITAGAFNSAAFISNPYLRNLLLNTTPAGDLVQPGGAPVTKGKLAEAVLRYTYECAMPPGTSMSVYVTPFSFFPGSSTSGRWITFSGKIGVASEWNTGACGENCQRWVTACLAARANKFGEKVKISLVGYHPTRASLRTRTWTEKNDFEFQEATFAGNIFNGEGVFACAGDGSPTHITKKGGIGSSIATYLNERVCGRDRDGGCAGFTYTGLCKGASLQTGTSPQCLRWGDTFYSCENPGTTSWSNSTITVWMEDEVAGDFGAHLPTDLPPVGGDDPWDGSGSGGTPRP